MKKLTKILMVALIAIMASCSKEGPQGPAGTNGTNGTNGNANVQYSDWMAVPSWTGYGTATASYDWAVSNITQEVLDNAAVLIYYRYGTEIQYKILPYFESATKVFSGNFSVGHILLKYQNINGGTVTPSADQNKFRYMIIPGNTHLRLKKPLNQMTYEEVCKLYNIPM